VFFYYICGGGSLWWKKYPEVFSGYLVVRFVKGFRETRCRLSGECTRNPNREI
jgi:hypothetical protein